MNIVEKLYLAEYVMISTTFASVNLNKTIIIGCTPNSFNLTQHIISSGTIQIRESVKPIPIKRFFLREIFMYN